MSMIKHYQSTQSIKYAISLQYLKKEGSSFFACRWTWKFLLVGIIVFAESGQTFPKYPKWKGHVYCTELLIFMGIIFCSSVMLAWNFSSSGVNNFISKKAKIPINLSLFFNSALFLFCRFLKSVVTNEVKSLFLWKSKKVKVTLVWSGYVWRTATATF